MAIITVVPQAARNAGTYTSPTWHVPAGLTKNVVLRAVLLYPYSVRRVWATGTSATNIYVVY